MGPKSRIWTEESESLLIDLVRSHPILWDTSLNEYRYNARKETKWEEIAATMGSPFTADMVKKRFSNMRDTFMDNQRKVRESKQRSSGKGPDDLYKPKWNLYNSLLFLKKTCAQSSSLSNLPNITTPTSIPASSNQLNLVSNVCAPAGTMMMPLQIAYNPATKMFSTVSQNSSHPITVEVDDHSYSKLILESPSYTSATSEPPSPLPVTSPLLSPQVVPRSLVSPPSVPPPSASSQLVHPQLVSTQSVPRPLISPPVVSPPLVSPSLVSIPSPSSGRDSPNNSQQLIPCDEQETRITATPTTSMRPASAPIFIEGSALNKTPDDQAEKLFVKRGSQKKTKVSGSCAEEALQCVKKLISEPVNVPQADSAECFGAFIAAKLREIEEPRRRKECENAILKVLLDF